MIRHLRLSAARELVVSKAPAAILFVLLTPGRGLAQAPTGTIAGFVSDPSGAALPGVQVSAVNRDTGQSRNATTSPEGVFSAPALPPGSYDVVAVAPGFNRIERTAGAS